MMRPMPALALIALTTLLPSACTQDATDVTTPEPLPSSLDAPMERVVATVAGHRVTIRELDLRDHPTDIDSRGGVLTAFGYLSPQGDEVRLAPDFWPRGLNGSTVVGYPGGTPQECPRPFALDLRTGERTALAFPDGWDAGQAEALNAAGRIVGWLGLRNLAPTCEILFQQAAAWWKDEVVLLRPLEEGDSTVAHAVNERGTIAGVSATRAVIWEDGEVRPVGPEGVYISYAWDVNDAGTVVGFAQLAPGGLHVAYLWEDGVTTILPALHDNAFARGVNDRGMVVGTGLNGDLDERAILWYRGEAVDLGTLGGTRSEARDINEAGEIAGWAEDADGVVRPVVWRVGG